MGSSSDWIDSIKIVFEPVVGVLINDSIYVRIKMTCIKNGVVYSVEKLEGLDWFKSYFDIMFDEAKEELRKEIFKELKDEKIKVIEKED